MAQAECLHDENTPNQVNNEKRGMLDPIPNEHLNAVVMLEHIFVEDQALEAEDAETWDSIDDNAMVEMPIAEEPVAESIDEANGNDESVIKYEIVLQQNDFEEIDGILSESCVIDSRQVEGESGSMVVNYIDQDESNDKVVASSQMNWIIQENDWCNAAQFRKKNVEEGTSSKMNWLIEENDNMCTAASSNGDWNIEEEMKIEEEKRTNQTEVNSNINDAAQFESGNSSGTVDTIDQSETIDEAVASTSVFWTKVAVDNNDSDDDILYVEPESSWPAPKTFRVNGLIKKENDRFSGNLPFGIGVCVRMQFAHFAQMHLIYVI